MTASADRSTDASVPKPQEPTGGEVRYGTQGANTYDEVLGATDWYLLGGNDILISQPFDWVSAAYRTDNYIDAGGGIDTIDYSLINHKMRINLAQEFGTWQSSWEQPKDVRRYDWDHLINFENVIGSARDDVIIGDGKNNQLTEGSGNDSLYGGNGNATLSGNTGEDSLKGGLGGDSLSGGTGADTLEGEYGNDVLRGHNGDDRLEGGDDNDLLVGGRNDDTLLGGEGADTLEGEGGVDVLDGGDGIDTALYVTGADIVLDLATGWAPDGLTLDALMNIENATTGSGDDNVSGSSVGNVIRLNGGNHVADGEAGNDQLVGGSGDDRLDGGADHDTLRGDSGKDTLLGGSGNDDIEGDSGADLIRGGHGLGTVTGGSGADVFRWEAWDFGQDQILDFNLAEDRIAFGENFLLGNPQTLAEMADRLSAWPAAGGDAALLAQTGAGWVAIATVQGVAASDLAAMIDSHAIFAAQVAPIGEGPGGLFG